MKLSTYVAEFVRDQGVKDIFLIPGGGCMHLADSFGNCEGLSYVANLHEQACAISAEAYSQYTQNLGVALVTTGPGGTNAITGLAGAYQESTPLLFISGQVKRADIKKTSTHRQNGPQEIDIISIVKPLTKYALTVLDPKEIRFHLEKALYLAKSGRPGPVWLDIPLDVQGAQIEPNELRGFDPSQEKPLTNLANLKSDVLKCISLLNQSKRPVLFAGNGIRLSRSFKQFEELMQTLQIPVLTTWKIIDLIEEDHPYYCGRPGSIGQRGANFTQQNSDFMLVLGARLDTGQTAFNVQNFARAAKRVVVDIDKDELNKFEGGFDVTSEQNVADFIQTLLELKNDIKVSPEWQQWLKHSKSLQAKYPLIQEEDKKPEGPVNLYHLMDVLSQMSSSNDIFVPGSSGACSEVFMQAFKLKKGQRAINTMGLGAMGFGLPASIGVCIASGRQRTILINGDGGLQMNIQELETIKRLNLPIKLLILNNDGYGSIMATQNNYFEGRLVASNPESGLTLPDLEKLATAYGLGFKRVLTQENLERDLREVLEQEGPVIVDLIVDPEHMTSPRVKSKVNPDGSITSMPMEDLWPYLDREEFKQNMLIPLMEESQW